jgi:hypothetical protein
MIEFTERGRIPFKQRPIKLIEKPCAALPVDELFTLSHYLKKARGYEYREAHNGRVEISI